MNQIAETVVLLAEDDAAVRTLAAALLREQHFCVLQACDGDEALRVARTHENIDLLLTDVEMGDGLNGIDLGSRLVAEHSGLRVLVMSGFLDGESTAARRGFRFLAKPFTLAGLSQRICEVLASKIPAQSETRAEMQKRLFISKDYPAWIETEAATQWISHSPNPDKLRFQQHEELFIVALRQANRKLWIRLLKG